MRVFIHPDEILHEDIEAIGMTATEQAQRIADILDSRIPIAGDTALRLERFFGTSAEF